MSFEVTVQDSREHSEHVQELLDIPRKRAAQLGKRSVDIQELGSYEYQGQLISIKEEMMSALLEKKSIPPSQQLILPPSPNHQKPKITICNETTLMAARRFMLEKKRVLVLNFANGVSIGGGFLSGSRAQEETLCFASTLYDTLKGDPFYEYNRKQQKNVSSAYAIVSTAIVFTDDVYECIAVPWHMDVLTCAAPVCGKWGGLAPEEASLCLHQRIRRVYEIAICLKYDHLILGAWGCGAFGNDAYKTAKSFRYFLENDFHGYFQEITFAISDWSSHRRFLSPFAEVFSQ